MLLVLLLFSRFRPDKKIRWLYKLYVRFQAIFMQISLRAKIKCVPCSPACIWSRCNPDVCFLFVCNADSASVSTKWRHVSPTCMWCPCPRRRRMSSPSLRSSTSTLPGYPCRFSALGWAHTGSRCSLPSSFRLPSPPASFLARSHLLLAAPKGSMSLLEQGICLQQRPVGTRLRCEPACCLCFRICSCCHSSSFRWCVADLLF